MRLLALSILAASTLAVGAPAVSGQAASPTMSLEAGPVLTQDDAIALALKHNKNLIVSSYGRGISRGQLLAARGFFDPAIQATRSGSNTPEQLSPDPAQISIIPPFNYRQDNYSVYLQGQTPIGTNYQIGGYAINERYSFYGFQNDYTTFAGFQVTQHLLKGFGFDSTLVNVRIAKAQRSISDLAYKQSAIATVTNVIIAYSNLLLAHDQLNSARKTHDLAAVLLAGNEKEYKVGSISQSDVLAARSNLAQYDEPIIIAERAVRDGQDALRELIGDEVFLDDEALYILVPPPSRTWRSTLRPTSPAPSPCGRTTSRPASESCRTGPPRPRPATPSFPRSILSAATATTASAIRTRPAGRCSRSATRRRIRPGCR